jgi:hypothetical protein
MKEGRIAGEREGEDKVTLQITLVNRFCSIFVGS